MLIFTNRLQCPLQAHTSHRRSDHKIVRLVVSVVGTGNEKGFKRLGKWTKRLYEALVEAHGAKVLQGLLVVGTFAEVFNIEKEGEGVKLVSASEKMSIRSSEFHEYLHKAAHDV